MKLLSFASCLNPVLRSVLAAGWSSPTLHLRHPRWWSTTFTALTGGDALEHQDGLFDVFSLSAKLRNHFRYVHSDKCSVTVISYTRDRISRL